MKSFAIIYMTFIFFFGINLHAQDLNHYKYVIVPEKFEFQDEANEYQLSALTEFLFEKYGFDALYLEEIPEDIDVCEALKANISNLSGFFTTRLVVTLEDCSGKVIFSSKEGESREKEYKKAYQEALRDAFLSVEALNYQYEPQNLKEGPKKVPLSIKINSNKEISEKEEATKAPLTIKITSEDKILENGNSKYILKETSSGFALFRYGEEEKFATLTQSAREGNYLYSSEKISGNAFFDASGNLVVEYIDQETGQLVNLKYLKKDQ